MVRFEYYEPASLEEAIDLLVRHGDAARPLAGGTALLVDMNIGHIRPTHLVSLTEVTELDQVRTNGGPSTRSGRGWTIGALTTLSTIEDYPGFLAGPTIALVEATHVLGGRQIRNVATVGGNICHASPGADMVPPLLCLDAELRLVGPDGERTTPLDGFLVGPDRTAIKRAEVLAEVRIPTPPARSGSTFLKVMRRHAMDCSIVAVAVRITLAKDGETCAEARIAVGAAAPVPFRAREAESRLEGRRLTDELVLEAAQRAAAASRPITDVRATAEYRRMLVRGLVTRAVAREWGRARLQPREGQK